MRVVILSSGPKFVFDLGSAPGTNDERAPYRRALQLNGQQLSDFTFKAESGLGPGSYLFDSTTDMLGSLGSDYQRRGDGFDFSLVEANSDTDIDLVVQMDSAAPRTLGAMPSLRHQWINPKPKVN
jgi:hypothetical protein